MKNAFIAALALTMAAGALPIVATIAPVHAQKVDQTGGTTNFVELTAQSSRFAIESSQLALQRSANTAVRGFASRIVKDYEQALGDLKFINASNASAAIPASFDDRHARMMERLVATPAPQFDHEYMQMQIRQLETALNLYRGYGNVGEVESLKAMTRKHLPTIERNLAEAKNIAGTLPPR